MNDLPWSERVPMLSIHPDAASRDDVAQLAAELMEARQQIMTSCAWKPDVTMWEETGLWNTACGESFMLVEGTPTENEMRFCPYCGRALLQAESILEKQR